MSRESLLNKICNLCSSSFGVENNVYSIFWYDIRIKYNYSPVNWSDYLIRLKHKYAHDIQNIVDKNCSYYQAHIKIFNMISEEIKDERKCI